MKSLFYVISVIFIAFSINAQESIYPIQMSGNKILIPTLYEDEPITSEKLIELISNDEIAFLNLSDKYNTPLRIKRLKSSDEYIYSIHPEFIAMRDSVLNNYYYYLLDLRDAQYNLQTKRFNFKFKCRNSNNTDLKGYLGIGNNLCLSCPSLNITPRKWGQYSAFLKSPIVSEKLAAEIEDGKYKLMFVFRFDRIRSEKRRDDYFFGIHDYTLRFVLCKTTHLYLYDSYEESVVADWSFLLTSPTRKASSATGKSKKKKKRK